MDYGTMKNNNILEIALEMQKEKGWISENEIKMLAKEFHLLETAVYETLSFYSMILLEAPAKVRIEVCRGTSCYVSNGLDLLKEIQNITECSIGARSKDGLYQIEYCECLGHCETAPNIVVNGKLYSSVTKDSVKEILKEASL